MRINHLSQILAPAALALAAFATHPAMAQSRLNVPFNFIAAGHSFPAGTYTVTPDRTIGAVILHGANGVLTELANTSGNAKDNPVVSLKFDRVDKTYYLRTVQVGQLVTRKLDSRIRETIPQPEVAALER
jgi:hypothetical protein